MNIEILITPRNRALSVPLGLVASSLLALSLMTGCASTPTAAHKASTAAALDCSQLSVEIAKTEQARDAALQKKTGAWKAIVPFAVAARYSSGKSGVEQAEARLVQLRTEAVRDGCTS